MRRKIKHIVDERTIPSYVLIIWVELMKTDVI